MFVNLVGWPSCVLVAPWALVSPDSSLLPVVKLFILKDATGTIYPLIWSVFSKLLVAPTPPCAVVLLHQTLGDHCVSVVTVLPPRS